MNPDDLKQAWQSQRTQPIDAELLLKDLERKQRDFATTIFWRDVREVGVSLILVPVWLVMGITLSPAWTWYLMIPSLFWIAGVMFIDRMRHKPQPHQAAEPLRQYVESLLAQVEHQIWLLRNVFWWYLMPIAVPMFIFFGQTASRRRSLAEGWLMAIFVSIFFAFIYWFNQYAIRSQLEPRRQELETLLDALDDETA